MSDSNSLPPKLPRRRSPRRSGAPSSATEGDDGRAALPEISTLDAVKYTADTLAELARLVRRHRTDTLAYLIEVAHLEALGEIERRGARHSGRVRPGSR